MKRSISFVLIAAFLPISLFSSEPSAFGAGDLNSASPYGLTTSEKAIFGNKQKLESLNKKTLSVNSKVDSLRERIDGFQTVLESIADKSHKNSTDINALLQSSKDLSAAQKERNDKIDALIQTNTENIEKLKALITEISASIDTINTNYVSKEEFNNLVKDINEFKKLVGSSIKSSSRKSGSSLDSMKTSTVYNKAESYYKSKNYTKAIEYFTYLISKKYKPAYSNYMLGEINYKRKNYGDAIAFYKTSATLYDKAKYMPNLMLHTALSMKYTKDNDNAKKFFNALIAAYPSSSEAKTAKKALASLK
ncbi:tetratricopeptide repeat protein [Sulfurimonas sp. HSL-1716]|uniref:tetratricopeptide repeat protein n=1 Tax=Hydrocurvibacter sulfurireducens TaxID=3131937 RepID=UPI0031F995AE